MSSLREHERRTQVQFKCLESINFDHDFSSFHIKWRPPVIERETGKDERTIWSDSFRTPVPKIPVVPRWILRKSFCNLNKENETATLVYHLEPATEMLVPIIYRMTAFLPDGTKIHTENGVRVCVQGEAVQFYKTVAWDIMCQSVILQMWLFIPNVFLHEIRGESPRNRGAASTSTGASRGSANVALFEAVTREVDPNPEEDESFFDVKLVIVNDDKEPVRTFRCHRHILAEKSEVFRRMFLKRNWAESSATAIDRLVEITDIDPVTMEKVLAFVYTGALPNFSDAFENNQLVKLIYAADKYDLADLKEQCAIISIWKSNDPEAVDLIDQLLVADMHNLARLKIICILQLCTDLTGINGQRIAGRLSDQLFTEMVSTYEKYGCTMKEIELKPSQA